MKLFRISIFYLICIFLFPFNSQAQSSRDSLLNRLNILLNSNAVESKNDLLSEAKKLEQSKLEDDLILASKIYKELGEEAKINTLKKDILKKFPNGITARQKAADDFLTKMENQSPQWVEQQYKAWLKKFSPQHFDTKNRGTYDMVLMQVVKQYLATEQYQLMDKYKNSFLEQNLKTMTYYAIAESFFKSNKLSKSKIHIDSALMWSDQSRQSTDIKVKTSFGAMMYNNIALLTAQIDLKQGNPYTAVRLLPDILHNTKYQPMHGETMIFTLADAYKQIGANLDALLELKNYAYNNEDVDKVWEVIQELYYSMNGQDGNFSQLKAQVEEEKNNKHLQALKAKLVNTAVPNFKLRNLDGNEVKLSDYKGKIIILDFWATWCVPCVRSFPAMQQLVNEFKDDQEVAFLFINTWEKQKNFKQAVQELMTKNGYNFDVVFDELNENIPTLLASQLGVPSLPTKILVDKKGNMRLLISGSETNSQAIIKEVKNLIEIGKNLD